MTSFVALSTVAIGYLSGVPPVFTVLLAAYFVISAVPLLRFPGKVDFFDAGIFSVLMTVPIVAHPFVLMIGRNYVNPFLGPLQSAEMERLVVTGMALLTLGALAYVVGYFVKSPYDASGPERPASQTRWSRSAVVLLAVSLLAFALFVRFAGGLEQLLIFSERRETASGLHYLRLATLWIQIVPLLLLAKDASRGRRPSLATFMALIACSVPVFLFGGRGAVVLGWMYFMIAYNYLRSRLSLSFLVVLALMVTIFSSSFLAVRRSTFGGERPDFAEAARDLNPLEDVREFIEGRIAFDVTVALLWVVPAHFDFQYGRTYLGALAAPIPRSVWPDKPIIDESGIVGRLLLGSDYYGIPPGNAGLFYLNFNVVGVVLGFLILGMLHSAVNRYRIRHADALAVLAYSILLPNIQSLSVIGLADAVFAVVPIVFMMAVRSFGRAAVPTQSSQALAASSG